MKRIKQHKSLFVALLVVMMLFVTACGSGSAPPADSGGGSATPAPAPAGSSAAAPAAGGPETGGILKMTVTAEGAAPLGVPWENTTNDTLFLVPMIESLVKERSDGTIEPFLADSYNIDMDAKEIVFKLHEGVKFHDGTDFTSEDAVFCLEQSIAAGQLQGGTGAEARGDYEVAVKFDAYQNQMLGRLASKTCGMISKDAFDKNGLELARETPVGTGAFVFKDYVRGEKLEVVRNENYWDEGKPYLDGVTYLFIRDVMTQQAAMQSTGDQSLDVLLTTSGEQAKTLEDLGFVVEKNAIGPLALIPSSKDENSPLSNPDVRKAIAWAIDRDSMMAARGFGMLTPAYQMISADWGAHLPDEYNIGYDPEKAKQYLADAGYPDGFSTKIIAMPGFADRDAMVIMQAQLAEVGIQVELEFPDSGGYNNYRATGWDGLLAQHFRVAANPNNMWNVYIPPEDVSLVSLQRTPELLDAILKSSQTPEVDQAATQNVVQIMYDEMTMIPVYDVYDIYVRKANIQDGEFAAWGGSTVWLAMNAWLSKE